MAYDPNLVHFYFPQSGHPDYGVVRVIVRDSEDYDDSIFGGSGLYASTKTPTFIDSDGCVADGGCVNAADTSSPTTTPTPPRAQPGDGNWHFITLSTHPGGGKGILLYHDGQLVAEMVDNAVYADADGNQHPAVGGAPMELNGNLTLCSRTDMDPDRFFTGSIAHLSVYSNTTLTGDQVEALYQREVVGSVCQSGCEFYDNGYWCTSYSGENIVCYPLAATTTTTTTTTTTGDGGDGSDSEDGGGMSGGMIAAIVLLSVGGAVAIGSVGMVLFNAYRHRRHQRKYGGGRFDRFHDNPAFTFPTMTTTTNGSSSTSIMNTNADGMSYVELTHSSPSHSEPMQPTSTVYPPTPRPLSDTIRQLNHCTSTPSPTGGSTASSNLSAPQNEPTTKSPPPPYNA